jgi:hypothetical protein
MVPRSNVPKDRPALSRLLDSAGGDSQLRRYLSRHDWVVIRAFRHAFKCPCCVPRFTFGARARCDFLVLAADSGAWFASFVLLGPVGVSPYADSGDTKELTALKNRVADLKQCVNAYNLDLRTELSRVLAATDCGPQNLYLGRGNGDIKASDEILDPATVLRVYFYIVMGRRAMLSTKDQLARARDAVVHGGGYPIATYDRLLDIGREADPSEPAFAKILAEDETYSVTPDDLLEAKGPAGIGRFSWDGEEYAGLTTKPWLLVNHLWTQPRREADIDDLAYPVYGDREEIPSETQVGSLRRQANRFFEKYRLPLRISIRGHVVGLVEER